MKFWDTSAIIPLLALEPTSGEMRSLVAADRNVVVWALAPIEISSALWRKYRTSHDDAARSAAERRLTALEQTWTYVDEFEPVLRRARQLLSLHQLRAADALQLAAALIVSNANRGSLPFVTLDDDLALAARAEGFAVLP